jgi:hypothetical protein
MAAETRFLGENGFLLCGSDLNLARRFANMEWSHLYPQVGEDYHGPKGPFYFLVLLAVVGTARSLIHMFAADGGAASIAGLAVDVAGGANLIALFGQWGASQLILAGLQWLVILRYRFLTPLMLAVVVLEQLLRLVLGRLKPLQVATPPPGAIGSQLLLPLAALALLWSLRPPARQEG